MIYTHTLNIEWIKDGEIKKVEKDFSFSNGVKETSKHTIIPPDMSVESQDELAHVEQHINELKRRLGCDNGDFIKFELNKKI